MSNEMTELRAELRHQRVALWDLAERFVLKRDAHGVHDMMVEIGGIEAVLRFLEAQVP